MRKSHIYVDRAFVPPGVMLRDPTTNRAEEILEKYYDDLPRGAQREYDQMYSAQRQERTRTRLWAIDFRKAWVAGDPLPTARFGSTVHVDTSTYKGLEDMASMGRAYFAVLEAGPYGVTSVEARLRGEVGGGISGALSKLHRYGVIYCLEKTR